MFKYNNKELARQTALSEGYFTGGKAMATKHRWQEITHSAYAEPVFVTTCVRCGQQLQTNRPDRATVWGDLSGPAFVYHCGVCVDQIEGENYTRFGAREGKGSCWCKDATAYRHN